MLPTFTLAEFLEMMSRYNVTFWPLQLVAYALGIAAVVLALRSTAYSSKIISVILALFWLWVGVVFNWAYFRPLYPMAVAFVALFVIEAGVLVYTGVFKQSLSFKFKADANGIAGALLVLYAMIGYPAIEYLLGRGYPSLLPFGLVPCPMTVFTFGLLLWTDKKLPWYVWAIPFLYSLSGVIPIWLGIVEDVGLVAAGLLATGMILYRDRAARAG
jgi:Family of unknown function (DUF6064)